MRALALVVVALLLAACGGRSAADSPPAPVPAGLEEGCPEPTTELRFPGGDLPPGATQVRLCPDPLLTDYNGESIGVAIQAPADLLTTGVAQLVTLVNGQPGVERSTPCNADAGPELVYWFGYPGGDWRAVQLGSNGCNHLTVGEDLRREGGVELATAFTEALVSQREDEPAPGPGGAVSCPAWPGVNPHSALVLPDVDLSVATWCVSPRSPRVREAVAPPDLVSKLTAELWPGLPTRTHPCGEAALSWIEALTPWGDSVGFSIDSCGEIHPLHGAWVLNDRERHYVTPELEAALHALPLGPLVDATTASVPDCPVWDTEPTYAEGDLPAGAVSLRVCSGEDPDADAFPPVGVPGEALTTGVDDLAALANELPAWEPRASASSAARSTSRRSTTSSAIPTDAPARSPTGTASAGSWRSARPATSRTRARGPRTTRLRSSRPSTLRCSRSGRTPPRPLRSACRPPRARRAPGR